ncbi:DUF7683 domain-containing protein [Chitinibacteraceae bacterium HSL-7]
MKIVRVIEVWEKGMDGAFLTHHSVAENVSVAFLLQLFVHEQDSADPDMKLSYMLDADRVAKLQPYVAEQMDASRYDYILTAFGVPD